MKGKHYVGIDYFRIVAALFVVAIHTAPFSSIDSTFDYLISYNIGRIAVPFFFMVTGFFVIAPYLENRNDNKIHFWRYMKKTTGLYLIVCLFYIPISIYAKNFPSGLGGILKMIFFDGSFYHLWYFPASILGCLLIALLGKKLSLNKMLLIAFIAYLFGLLGDSYFGLIADVPIVSNIYKWIFSITSYTRNGIFFAPIFLLLGACLANKQNLFKKSVCRIGLLIFLILMLIEGYTTYSLDLQKHNSMYLFLIPTMFFLFQLLLIKGEKTSYLLRNCSMWIYILHPFVIIVVRAIAKITGLTKLLVTNTLIHYLCVCILSIIAALGICLLTKRRNQSVPKRSSLD